jgi:enamine deaminase RidA (YjgF/YER057c/UK114 family)
MSGIERFASGGQWEAGFGYSRAVRAGDLVLVAGTTAIDEDGVVHGERFGEHPPVASMVGVAALIDPRMLVEIEVMAYVGA